MKKGVLTIAAIGLTFAGFAQDKFVTSAATALSQKSYDEAKADIDKAMSSPETNTKPKALYTKAQIYFTLQQIEKYAALKPYREATQALIKLAEVKPDYEKEEVSNNLAFGAFMYFNDANVAFNDADKSKPGDKKLDEAIEWYKQTIKIHDLGGGKRFEKFARRTTFDTVAANAQLYMARSAYYQGNLEEGINQMNKVKSNPITKSSDSYLTLLKAYSEYNAANANKLATAEMETIQEARVAFPNDANIRNTEMNYYLKNGKMADLVKKIEDGLKSDPANGDMNFNVALLYQGMASPKEGAKPANATELNNKAEAAFKKAVAASPESANYLYNFGALYFNMAYDVNEQMNKQGTSPAEMKKYDELKKQRNAYFDQAKPMMEKAVTNLGSGTMKDSDKDVYRACLVALKQMYAVADNKAKVDEFTAKLDAFDKQ